MNRHLRHTVLVVLLPVAIAAAVDPSVRAPSSWPPAGRSERVPVNRDVWLSNAGDESSGNCGGASRWKLKGIQEFTLFDADLSAFKGRRITGALLHVRCASPGAPLSRVTVSTVATPWVEGTGNLYEEQAGSACFNSPAAGEREWAYPGSTLVDAAWGKGNTIWRFAEASAPDAGGWQTVAVEPAVVAANAAGLSHGFAAMDDVGSEWSVVDGKFKEERYRNRYLHSRHEKGSEPWLEIWTDGTDARPPDPVAGLMVDNSGLPPGQALLKWKTPSDADGRVLGFRVRLVGRSGREAPRYLVPMAGNPGEEVRMLLQDLDLESGQRVTVGIVPVDTAGNDGPERTFTVVVSDRAAEFLPDPSPLKPFETGGPLPEVGNLRVCVLDLLDKVEARSGGMIPPEPEGYKGGNHLWSASAKRIRLQAARNETVAFQVNVEGQTPEITFDLRFPKGSGLTGAVHQFDYVEADNGIMPDALKPVSGPVSIPDPRDPQAAGQSNASFVAEIHVSRDARPGPVRGTLSVAAGGRTLDLGVDLTVWNFTLPDKLSFVPEMNCYNTPTPTGPGLAYYRLAHAHRTCMNRLYYGWSCGIKAGAAPDMKPDGSFDWTRYDREFGPLFDGSAFADLPRAGEPLDVFYLPFNESWPTPIREHYKPNYWADEAFGKPYADGYRRAFADFARHFNEKGWHDTIFEFYLNNKMFFRREPNAKGILATWIMDEPGNIQDFWALRWYGILFHQGVDPVRGDARMWFRCDISRPAFSRNMLWGVMDMEVMGGAKDQQIRMKRDERILSSPVHCIEYGTANDPKDANTQPVLWSLRVWSRGGVGVLPWQTIGKDGAWDKAEATSLFYPSPDGPLPSVRLKAFTRAQQDVEYLELLSSVRGVPREAVAAGLARVVDVTGRIAKKETSDAGTWQATGASPLALWDLRTRVAAMLDAMAPAYKRVVRPLPTPPTDMSRLPSGGYVSVAPEVPSTGPKLPQGL
jgi:hypothetical protein